MHYRFEFITNDRALDIYIENTTKKKTNETLIRELYAP